MADVVRLAAESYGLTSRQKEAGDAYLLVKRAAFLGKRMAGDAVLRGKCEIVQNTDPQVVIYSPQDIIL